jgi:hypothetical protein
LAIFFSVFELLSAHAARACRLSFREPAQASCSFSLQLSSPLTRRDLASRASYHVTNRVPTVELAAKSRFLALCEMKESVEIGGLMFRRRCLAPLPW